jgi:ethanolamine utilization protein EutA
MSLRLVAFDFGSTTAKALEATAELVKNVVTGRTEIQSLEILSRNEPVFTPFKGEDIDFEELTKLVDFWLTSKGTLDKMTTVTGGVIITGLAAKKRNARVIADTVRKRLGEAVIAVADDPSKESWLAFMGSCATLSGTHPQIQFINMDIGGGTTNLARGVNSHVQATGSLWIGARHFQFTPGTYQLREVSRYGLCVLEHLQIKTSVGQELSPAAVAKIVAFYVDCLESIAKGKLLTRARFLEQLAFPAVRRRPEVVITFSGGVGELVYRYAKGERFSVTLYGDLGDDLARGIVQSPLLSRHLASFVPANLGRATVSGLAFFGVEASGATVYLPNRAILPLRDLPLLGRISSKTTKVELEQLFTRAFGFPGGACLRADCESESLDDVRFLAKKVAAVLKTCSKSSRNRYANEAPLIIFLAQNLGKTFGQYATEWGRIAANLIVIDEIESSVVDQKACFASIFPCEDGTNSRSGNMLVSFYGGFI